jgi:hypothetical protein
VIPLTKNEALAILATASRTAAAADAGAANLQGAKRENVRDAFAAGCTGTEIAEVRNASPQYSYQLRDKTELKQAILVRIAS